MCSVWKYPTSIEDEMSLDEIIKIISIAKKKFNIKDLVITGGEPLLLGERIIKISEFASAKNINIILTTNGFFLKDYVRDLIKAGISHFHISIDGLKSSHNYIRDNALAFDKAVEAIKVLNKLRKENNYDYSIGIGVVVLKNNIADLYNLYMYGDELGVNIFDMLAYLPDNTDFFSMGSSPLWPSLDSIHRLVEEYKKIVNAGAKHIKLNEQFDINLMIKYYKRKLNPKDWRCFAGFKNFFIVMADPNKSGRMEPCLFLCKDHIPLRDYNYDLTKVWYSCKAQKARLLVRNCKSYCYQMCFSLPTIKSLFKRNPEFNQ